MYIGDLAYVRKARGLKGLRLSTGGGSAQPLGALVINGTPIVLNSIPVQKAS